MNADLNDLAIKWDTKSIYQLFDVKNENCLLEIDPTITAILREADLRADHVIFFIPPIDVTYLNQSLDPSVIKSIQKRMEHMYTCVCSKGHVCLDMHAMLKDSRYFPDEYRMHLNDEGRQQVALILADYIRHIEGV